MRQLVADGLARAEHGIGFFLVDGQRGVIGQTHTLEEFGKGPRLGAGQGDSDGCGVLHGFLSLKGW